MRIKLTELSASLIAAGLETPLFRKRLFFMSQPVFWLERESHNRSIGGVRLLRKRTFAANRKQRRK
jgi:hypothetical protein